LNRDELILHSTAAEKNIYKDKKIFH